MDVLVIGNGGREHAICHGLKRSPETGKLYCAPGNPGIGEIAELVPIKVEEIDAIANFAEEKKIGLVVVGPEVHSVWGLRMLSVPKGSLFSVPPKTVPVWKAAKISPRHS